MTPSVKLCTGYLNPRFHKTEHSYGYSIGAICLFDFKDQPPDLCRDWYFRGWSPYRDDSPVNVFLALSHQWLLDKLIPNSAAKTAEPYKQYIPYIEVWCKEWIPANAITTCIVCCNVDQGEFASTQGNDRLSEWVEQKVIEFQTRYADAYKQKEEQRKILNSFYRRTALH